MRITTKGRYALRAVLYLAAQCQNRPVSIKQIAQEEKISPEFLEQIFFKLKKAGLINSMRGPGGGFMLNRQANEMSVRDIFDAVGEGLDLTPCTCTGPEAENCPRATECLAHTVWKEASDRLLDFFENLTVGDILARKGKFYETIQVGQDFSI